MPVRRISDMSRREYASVEDKTKKKKMLTGGQAKLDKNKNNKIDAEDFKLLRKEKVKPVKAVLGIATMGLMGAKMLKDKKKAMAVPGVGAAAAIANKKKEILGKKRGGAMKAKRGRLVPLKSDPTKAIRSVKPSAGGKGSGTTNLGNPRKKGEPFLERRMKLAGVKSMLGKAGRIGLLGGVLGVAGAGAAKLGQTIGRKMSEKKNKKMGGGMMKKYNKGGMSAGDKFNAKIKGMLDSYDDKKTPMKKDRIKQKLKASGKMGGGMMQRPMSYMGGGMMKPMGYKAGKSVKAKCKLGRNKPTKMY